MSWIWLGMGWVGSWVHKFTWQWVGLGWICMSVGWVGLGWVVGYENGPMDNSAGTYIHLDPHPYPQILYPFQPSHLHK